MRILLVTDYLPYPAISGDTIRVYNLIRRISQYHEIHLLALFESPGLAESIAHLSKFCCRIEVVNHEWPNPLTCLPDMLTYYRQGKPFELRLLYSQKMSDLIRRLTSEEHYDIVQIEHSRLALYQESIDPDANCASTLTFHNVAYDQSKRISRIERNPISSLRTWIFARQLLKWEPSYAERFDRCFVVSEAEHQTLLANNSHLNIDVIPNGTDTRKYQRLKVNQDGPPALIFIGSMSYAPCVDGAVYFCEQILPYIQRTIQNVQVWIVGASPLPEVTRLAGENVHVTGYVEDVLPYYQQATVSIVPLRAGGGTRLKILEAMALGRPVVSTSIGCEGLDVLHEQHLLIADEPDEFAKQTIRLLTDRALYRHIAEQARELVVENYDWDVIAEKLLKSYEKTVH